MTTRRAFTLIEILVAILIIFLLMGLLIVAVSKAMGLARGGRDLAQVTAIHKGVLHFKSEFGFIPPLVKDFDSGATPVVLINPRWVPVIYKLGDPTQSPVGDPVKLRRGVATVADVWLDLRFSTSTIPYYLIGALETPRDTSVQDIPIDGVPGLGFFTPKRDGLFEKSGRKFDPFYDVGKSSKQLFTTNAVEGRVELRDSNGVPIRYYRWLTGDPNNRNRINKPDDANVPFILYRDARAGDPPVDPDPDPIPNHLLSAEYAIVGAGPNGVFGDEPELFLSTNPVVKAMGMDWPTLAAKVSLPDPSGDVGAQRRVRYTAMKDNIVEVGN